MEIIFSARSYTEVPFLKNGVIAIFELDICEEVIADIWYSKMCRKTPMFEVIFASIAPPLAQKIKFLERPSKNKRRRHLQPFGYKIWRMRTFLQLPITRCIQNWMYTFSTFILFSMIIYDPIKFGVLSFPLCIWYIIMIADCILQVNIGYSIN